MDTAEQTPTLNGPDRFQRAGNTFRANVFEVGATGWAILVEGAARAAANTVSCDNRALVGGADTTEAVSNVPCS